NNDVPEIPPVNNDVPEIPPVNNNVPEIPPVNNVVPNCARAVTNLPDLPPGMGRRTFTGQKAPVEKAAAANPAPRRPGHYKSLRIRATPGPFPVESRPRRRNPPRNRPTSTRPPVPAAEAPRQPSPSNVPPTGSAEAPVPRQPYRAVQIASASNVVPRWQRLQ
ncbi:hypothetical protein FRX31_033850, partial [Thalictrum thalictroides]